MNKPKKLHPLVKTMNNSLVNLPTPTSISYLWNWGSMLGIVMVVQLLTGVLLASHYNPDVSKAFESVISITRNVEYGFGLRYIHMNAASVFFMCIFIHISRGLHMSSFKLKSVWLSGVLILLILMGTAFLGYVLPWGQMSFWGATVITNLVSAIPYMGSNLVLWLWGGFSIGEATLNRFFTLHFMMPFVLMAMILFHLISLHTTGSNKPTGSGQDTDKMSFHPFFSSKDMPTMVALLLAIMVTSMMTPFSMGDPENFNLANPLNTPIHIQPEWYFLFAYAILRSIPNKLGGVVALFLSITFMAFLPFFKKNKTSKKWNPPMKSSFWVFTSLFIMLTWLGAMPVEDPFESTSKTMGTFYFSTTAFL